MGDGPDDDDAEVSILLLPFAPQTAAMVSDCICCSFSATAPPQGAGTDIESSVL